MASNVAGFEQIVDSSSLYINSILLSNDATTPNTKLDVGPGICRDQSNSFDLNIGNYGGVISGLSANTTTVIDASVVGVNGIDTGTFAASKVYYVYVVADTVGVNPTGAMISLNAPSTGPVMPYNYNAYRHVGFAVTDASSHFLLGYYFGTSNSRSFTYDAPQATAITAGNATSYTTVALTAFVPAVANTPVVIASDFTPGAASRTLKLQPYGATGDAVTITGQVTSVHVTSNSTVAARLNSAAPSIAYKVANSGDAVALNVAAFAYTV